MMHDITSSHSEKLTKIAKEQDIDMPLEIQIYVH